MKNSSIFTVLILSCLISMSTVLAFDGNNKKALLIFSADWCQYCQVAKNDMEKDPQLSEIIKNYEIIELDYAIDKEVFIGYDVKVLPTFVIMHKGKEIGRKVGYSNGANGLYKLLK